ncbi:hypothetical protein Z517_08381 [Fonsecaea pedrosoi CBS 271.37]|uniref:3-oxoacyl-[acyl-carrier-protein] reductase n=1 Tax=Fonsecaea pedrosoi CBS 271.37 TaxID=1442368 RepID=A0A0D2GCV8_9EURO|nr:uncharacterized protein Z517_08381 [Fonsecaea pedrosoi CBS 271.37]KIW78543.1 hypothetical protein Z517_08381 [Fonsecaea pedrosoi CBS 271.37]
MSPADRVKQITRQITFPKGLLIGQVAIITGSGQGIGAETARLFANEGAKVVVQDIDTKRAEDVAQGIRDSGGEAIAVPGDMLDFAYIPKLVQEAAKFGNGKIHIIVNNAGFTWDSVIHKMTDEAWKTIIDLHCTAPFMLVRAAAPYFRVADGERRCIINISSVSGIHGNAGQANYSLAKAGVTGLTKTIAKEWGPKYGVRSITVAFGYIKGTRLSGSKEAGNFAVTPDGKRVAIGVPQAIRSERDAKNDVPLGRPGKVPEAAAAIMAAASPLFDYITGETLMVTGGK